MLALHQEIHRWYATYGRKELPWRNTDDPYRIYISEIMLQQTQVKTVLARFYTPFLEQFPTLEHLANAPLQEVIKAWEGLGYYNRARHLHQAAQLTSPTLPRSLQALQALPGIGKNTAHAIAAFAYHHPVPVMEANVKRILHRFYSRKILTEKELWTRAYQLLDSSHPFDYNQAMMDIGAMICLAKNPKCVECPLRRDCKGKTHPERYPAPKKKTEKPVKKRSILLWENSKKELYLTARTGRFLHGMYGFDEHSSLPKNLTTSARSLGSIRHQYSHFTLEAEIYHLQKAQHAPLTKEGEWYSLTSIERLPLSGADKKALTLYKKTLGL